MKTLSKVCLLVALCLVVALVAVRAEATREAPLAAWLFATAKELPRSHAPGETETAEAIRLERISRAYAFATLPYANGHGWTASELGMALLILADEETRLDERIHAGGEHPVWTQDHGLAKCLGQLHVSKLVPQSLWAKLGGTDEDATRRCAEATALVWVAVAKNCGVWLGARADRNRVAEAFMAYGSGGKCKPDERAWSRADKWLARMQKRPDRSPIPGYRRAMPSEVEVGVAEEAEAMRGEIHGKEDVGEVRTKPIGEHTWAFRVEAHEDGKVGVSVLVAEN